MNIKTLIHVISFISIIIPSFLSITNTAFAEMKTFSREYIYQASELDSKISCRTIALENAKRLLLEELGVYLETYTEVQNYQLSKDKIIALTAGVVNVKVIEETWDGKNYLLKAEITADTDDVAKSIDNLRKNRESTLEFEEMQKKANEYLREIDRLKKQLIISKDKKNQSKPYNNTVNKINANEWYEKGYKLISSSSIKHPDVIEAFTKAIEYDPQFAEAYLWRGHAYRRWAEDTILNELLSQSGLNKKPDNDNIIIDKQGAFLCFNKAINDYSKSIKLKPKNPDFLLTAYWGRGTAYARLDKYQKAIDDFNELIRRNPKRADSYENRGDIYFKFGKYRKSIDDYSKVISVLILYPGEPYNQLYMMYSGVKEGNFYVSRGKAYQEIGKYKHALDDYNTASRMGNREAKYLIELLQQKLNQ